MLKIDNKEFYLYRRGVHTAKVLVKPDSIEIVDKDLATLKWEKPHLFEKEDDPMAPKYCFPFEKLEKYKEIIDFDFSKDGSQSFVVSHSRYEKSYRVSDPEGELAGADVWTEFMKDGGNSLSTLMDIIVCEGKVVGFIAFDGWEQNYLILPGYERVTPQEQWSDPLLSKSGRGVKEVEETMVAMRDGVKLATDVFLPADYIDGEKLPTVFLRSCYGRKRFCEYDTLIADRGYAVVTQDVRGRGDSEGEFVSNYYEKNDGSDSLDWIASQPWSNGDVGTIGGSYEGYTQWLMAASGNPHHKAIVALSPAGSPFTDVERRGGAYAMAQLPWYISLVDKEVHNMGAYEAYDWAEIFKMRPEREIIKNVTGKEALGWNLMYDHPDYDEYWEEQTMKAFAENINVPALHIDGLFDCDWNGFYEAWSTNLSQGNKNQRAMLGPWMHYNNTSRGIVSTNFSYDSTRLDFDITCVRWFDKFLKGIDNGVESPVVEYYVPGLNQWKNSSAWPPAEKETRRFYLHCGDENPDEGGRLDEEEPSEEESPDEYKYDPTNPTPSIFDPSTEEYYNPDDYQDIERRNDVLIYTSAPFEENQIIAGKVTAYIMASSDAPDTDFCARLTYVDEEGRSIRITDGILRAKYRESFKSSKLLNPDDIEEYIINLSYASVEIKEGYRLRVEVCSSLYGLYFPNDNTGNDPSYSTDHRIANQTIYHDKTHPSFIEIDIIR